MRLGLSFVKCTGISIALLFGLLACEIPPPKGVTAFIIEDATEYASALLVFPESEEHRPPLKLKYADANTFQTTATLSPGKYTLVVRTEWGRYAKAPVEIEAEKKLYRLKIQPQPGGDTTPAQSLTLIRGKVFVREGPLPREIYVLMVARDATLKRTPVLPDGSFSIQVPAPGTYWIQIFTVGTKALRWEHRALEVRRETDLGQVPLRPVED